MSKILGRKSIRGKKRASGGLKKRLTKEVLKEIVKPLEASRSMDLSGWGMFAMLLAQQGGLESLQSLDQSSMPAYVGIGLSGLQR